MSLEAVKVMAMAYLFIFGKGTRLSPTPILAVFTQNLVPDLLNLGVRVLSDAYMFNTKLYIFNYGFIF